VVDEGRKMNFALFCIPGLITLFILGMDRACSMSAEATDSAGLHAYWWAGMMDGFALHKWELVKMSC
jgi:hypothetical protein